MEEELIDMLLDYDYDYDKIENGKLLKLVHDLFINNNTNINDEYEQYYGDFSLIELGLFHNYLGLFNFYIKKNYELVKLHYLKGIEYENELCMSNLGLYYQDIEKDYELMKKYYMMGIEKNCSTSMNNLGRYYKVVEENYELMKKYYEMAIERKNIFGLFNLVDFYDKNMMLDEIIELYDIHHVTLHPLNVKELLEIINRLFIEMDISDKKYEKYFNKMYYRFLNKKIKNTIENVTEPFESIVFNEYELGKIDCNICLDVNFKSLYKCTHMNVCIDCFIKHQRACPYCN